MRPLVSIMAVLCVLLMGVSARADLVSFSGPSPRAFGPGTLLAFNSSTVTGVDPLPSNSTFDAFTLDLAGWAPSTTFTNVNYFNAPTFLSLHTTSGSVNFNYGSPQIKLDNPITDPRGTGTVYIQLAYSAGSISGNPLASPRFDLYETFSYTTLSLNGSQFNNFGSVGPGTVSASAVPEPGSLSLLGIMALGMVGYGWRRRQQLTPAAPVETVVA